MNLSGVACLMVKGCFNL